MKYSRSRGLGPGQPMAFCATITLPSTMRRLFSFLIAGDGNNCHILVHSVINIPTVCIARKLTEQEPRSYRSGNTPSLGCFSLILGCIYEKSPLTHRHIHSKDYSILSAIYYNKLTHLALLPRSRKHRRPEATYRTRQRSGSSDNERTSG